MTGRSLARFLIAVGLLPGCVAQMTPQEARDSEACRGAVSSIRSPYPSAFQHAACMIARGHAVNIGDPAQGGGRVSLPPANSRSVQGVADDMWACRIDHTVPDYILKRTGWTKPPERWDPKSLIVNVQLYNGVQAMAV